MQCRKLFHGSSMEGMMGATHEWIISILDVYDMGLIKAWLRGSWPFMIKKAHDLVRSCIRTLRKGADLRLSNSSMWDGGCTGCKSKIDRVHWDMFPWLVRGDVHGLGRTDHDRDPYDLALLEVARNVAEDFPKVYLVFGFSNNRWIVFKDSCRVLGSNNVWSDVDVMWGSSNMKSCGQEFLWAVTSRSEVDILWSGFREYVGCGLDERFLDSRLVSWCPLRQLWPWLKLEVVVVRGFGYKGVCDLVQTRAYDIISTQVSQSEDGSFAFSNTLTLEQLNNLVLEAVPKKKGRYVGIGRLINDGSSSSVHCPYPVEDFMEQIKNKDEEIAILKTDNAEIRNELQVTKSLTETIMDKLKNRFGEDF
ncbi:hypothetical protein F2Q68_00002863 [Brassica cretica]|uniref:Uncharacterized protein n=1 Tax=Brassica cretica TaxID=69181 RepID=A0A8S9J7H1_BRACR|nr:hypothetical protein F2Q68_00002863 [Brassica cretica]